MAYTELKFMTFGDLMASILTDLRTIEEEGMIEEAQLIKIAQRVNYDLGLRIHQTHECVIDIENHTGRLPEDFYVLDFALLLGKHKTIEPVTWAGRITENVDVPCSPSGNTCANTCLLPLNDDTILLNPNKNYSICGGDNTCTPEWDPWFQRSAYSICDDSKCVKVVEKKKFEVREYQFFEKLYIKPQTYLDPGSINSKMVDGCRASAEIKNGFLYCNVANAKVYLSYQGALQDPQGNLLVLDHPLISLYYEAAIKTRIFENLYLAGEEVKEKLQYLKQEEKEARLAALNVVNMPDFSEIFANWKINRQAQYSRYYKTFQTGVFNSWFQFGNLY